MNAFNYFLDFHKARSKKNTTRNKVFVLTKSQSELGNKKTDILPFQNSKSHWFVGKNSALSV